MPCSTPRTGRSSSRRGRPTTAAPVSSSSPATLANTKSGRSFRPSPAWRAEPARTLRARMGGLVDGEEAFGFDAGVALRRRQAGVAEEFLDRAQIAARSEEVRRETVAQRVRRRRFGQPEIAAQRRHLPLHQARVERPAACADEKRPVLWKRKRTSREIGGDGVAPPATPGRAAVSALCR